VPAFAEHLASTGLPSAVVVDAALDVVLHAARPQAEFAPADRRFLRPLPEVVRD
jgi:hypothetical protein